MIKKVLLAVVVFLLVMLALTAGSDIFFDFGAWLQKTFGIVINSFDDLRRYVWYFVSHNWGKIIIGIVFTAIICAWLFRDKPQHNPNSPTSEYSPKSTGKERKIAILLAIFLGWLGVHRFYLNQIGMGVLFLIMSVVFIPLSIVIGFIDAFRYFSMGDDVFLSKFKP